VDEERGRAEALTAGLTAMRLTAAPTAAHRHRPAPCGEELGPAPVDGRASASAGLTRGPAEALTAGLTAKRL
jgi:nicotinamide mononucleotide (NMN) deamidase PncC